MATVPVLPHICANWTPDTSICQGKGEFACANCSLVLYCGKECQTAHWSAHKITCRSPIAKSSWRPAWDRERREPDWATRAAMNNLHNPYGGHLYLWGNVPAIDVLRLPENEGLDYNDRIELLFAASGDLRNVVKTIADLPTTTSQPLHITVNDKEFAVVARNTILLLFALVTVGETITDNGGRLEKAEMLMHLWYSAFIPRSTLLAMQNVVKPFIRDVCIKIADNSSEKHLGKTWDFPSGRSLRLVLTKSQWFELEKLLDMPDELTYQRATQIRHTVVLAPDRADYRDRWAYKEPTPFARVAKHRFREDGLLLPFGHPRIGYDTPNPLLFQDTNTWLMDDKADPMNGWPVWEILHHLPSSLAKEDIYGKLYTYLRHVFKQFLDRLAATKVSFEMSCLDARQLKSQLGRDRYTRIEVSNIVDGFYLGAEETLRSLAPLLQLPQRNPHATLVAVFLNAVMEMMKRTGADGRPDLGRVMRYLPAPTLSTLMNPLGADMTRIWDGRSIVSIDVDEFFHLYRRRYSFDNLQVSVDLAVAEKENNTIVEKWPTRVKLQIGQQGAQEEFDVLLGSNFSGMERYVEWKRTA